MTRINISCIIMFVYLYHCSNLDRTKRIYLSIMDTLFFLFTCLLSRWLFLPKTFSQQVFLFLNQIKTLDLLISKRPENIMSYSRVRNIFNTLYSMILQFQVAVFACVHVAEKP